MLDKNDYAYETVKKKRRPKSLDFHSPSPFFGGTQPLADSGGRRGKKRNEPPCVVAPPDKAPRHEDMSGASGASAARPAKKGKGNQEKTKEQGEEREKEEKEKEKDEGSGGQRSSSGGTPSKRAQLATNLSISEQAFAMACGGGGRAARRAWR